MTFENVTNCHTFSNLWYKATFTFYVWIRLGTTLNIVAFMINKTSFQMKSLEEDRLFPGFFPARALHLEATQMENPPGQAGGGSFDKLNKWMIQKIWNWSEEPTAMRNWPLHLWQLDTYIMCIHIIHICVYTYKRIPLPLMVRAPKLNNPKSGL